MEAQSKVDLGWIGLGSMGIGMAKNLQKYLKGQFQNLRYYNRTASRGAPLGALGGIQCDSIHEVTRAVDVIFISTSNDAALENIVDEIIGSGRIDGKIIVDTTTVHPKTSKAMSQKLLEAGASFIAAPVFGASPVAETGQLLVAVAGPSTAVETVLPYLKGVMARDVIRVSEEPEKATLLKTCGNFMIAGIMELIAEAHVFAEKTGLGSEVLEKLIEQNFGALAYSDSQRMTNGVYAPGPGQSPWSDLSLALKDVGHGISCAEDAETRLKTGEIALDHLKRAKRYAEEHGGRPLDSSSMYGVIREDAGLDFRTDLVKERDAC